MEGPHFSSNSVFRPFTCGSHSSYLLAKICKICPAVKLESSQDLGISSFQGSLTLKAHIWITNYQARLCVPGLGWTAQIRIPGL